MAELDKIEGHRKAAHTGFQEALALYEHLGDPDTQIARERLRYLEDAK